jgi:hypothetical protein
VLHDQHIFSFPAGFASMYTDRKAIPCDVRDHKIRFVFMVRTVKGACRPFLSPSKRDEEISHCFLADPRSPFQPLLSSFCFQLKGSNDFYLKVSTQASRFPTKALRLKIGGEWREGWPVHGSYFEFRDGAPFTFPMEVEITSVFGEVLTDRIESLQVGSRENKASRMGDGYEGDIGGKGRDRCAV